MRDRVDRSFKGIIERIAPLLGVLPRTYSVDQNTVVNSGRDGIGNVKNGDTVRVNAVVSNGKAAAHDIMDMTTLGQIRQHWNPNAPGGPQSGPPTTRT